jgi:hypothetical protein
MGVKRGTHQKFRWRENWKNIQINAVLAVTNMREWAIFSGKVGKLIGI